MEKKMNAEEQFDWLYRRMRADLPMSGHAYLRPCFDKWWKTLCKEIDQKKGKVMFVKIKYADLDFDEDFLEERAKELGLFKLKLDLPKGLRVIGYSRENQILIRKVN